MVADKNRDEFERRLDHLREEARAKGTITGEGVRAAGGPTSALPPTPEARLQQQPGYYGLPLLKPPVWKWMIAAYFFVGGLAGMSALIAAAALLKQDWALVRAALWSAGIGAVLSPILLIWDLGRPMRFLNMLRVLKFQSPMSVGSWIVSGFGAAAIPALALTEWHLYGVAHGQPNAIVQGFAIAGVISSAFAGVFLATYTGALVGATAVPAWHLHRAILPFHFGMAGLGSAAGVLELIGFDSAPIRVIGWTAAAAETLVLLRMEGRRHGAADEAVHSGRSGWTLRIGELLEGPLPLILRAVGLGSWAAASFVLGALTTRFGWLWAGKACAANPEAVFAGQRISGVTAPKHA